MAKHTQGEWGVATIDYGTADDEIVTEVNGCMVNIASVFGAGEYSEARPDGKDEPHYEVSKEEAAANARLIAAAPAMHNALLSIVTTLRLGETLTEEDIEIARRILKDVQGE